MPFLKNMNLTNNQIDDLSRPLGRILEKFYKNSQNEEDFQQWLKSINKENSNESD